MDIDIDTGNREQVLKLIKHVPASINRNGEWIKHNTGVFVTQVPINPLTNMASVDFHEAEDLGYVKLDLLNVHVYEQVKSIEHLDKLVTTEPQWEMLGYKEFVEQVIHINNHYNLLQQMPEPVNSIPRMAMFLALIRPAKRHLIGKKWNDVAKDIWARPTDDSYFFKKSHAVSYAHLVAVHMNLLCEI